ncbi:hypothetical protein H5410_035354 [Solanum commersonii]|uniref:Uncharacterized protein n=1 Tax=Solanum commersonii TaxID=4109 RepID=A0A9J5Y2G3_SOLCO|nr:hypothetical protein H5410_035354 [Solanum commersonii]
MSYFWTLFVKFLARHCLNSCYISFTNTTSFCSDCWFLLIIGRHHPPPVRRSSSVVSLFIASSIMRVILKICITGGFSFDDESDMDIKSLDSDWKEVWRLILI